MGIKYIKNGRGQPIKMPKMTKNDPIFARAFKSDGTPIRQLDEDEIKDRDNDTQEEIINREPRSPEW